MTTGSSFEAITEQLQTCLDSAVARLQTKADAIYTQVDPAGTQPKPALDELNAARNRALAEITDCSIQTTTDLDNAARVRKSALLSTNPQATQQAQEIDADAGATKTALISMVAASTDDVNAIRNRTARALSFKITAARWRKGRGGAAIVLLLVFMAAICFLVPPELGVVSWLAVVVLLLLAAMVIGELVCGVWWGILVDARNMISLSRLQLVTWTVLILSAFLTVALTNVSWIVLQRPHPLVDPLSIAIPQELWALMGISTASFVGATLIKSNKATNMTSANSDTSGQASLETQRAAPGTTAIQGNLVKNQSIVDASASDIFRGEEAGNADKVDLGKVQMFFFTFIVVLAYGFALESVLQGGLGRITEFPDLSPSMITLLGISHAGYLTIKGAPHTGTAPVQPQ